MKQRLAAALVMIAALLVTGIGLAAPANAADASVSSKLDKKVKKADKQKKKKCKKAKKAKGKSKKKAKKSCNKAKKKAKKLHKKQKKQNAQYFDVCKHGCKYNTIQKGANAAGKWQKKNKKRTATVRVQPGTYVEGVFLHGKQDGAKYDGLKIIGVKKNKKPNKNARAVVLEGKNAKTVVKNTPGWMPGDPTTIPANNAIEARSIDGIVFKNMWAKDYQNNTFFVWASNIAADNEHCADFVMDNLVSSDTRSYGLFSRNCFGGKFLNSEGWNHGDSALYIGETPCDSDDWTNRGPVKGSNPPPCQKDPDWTIVKNFKSHQNTLGYSGTNSKYVKITDSAFYNNGAGIVPNTLDSERFEPNGWMIFENNDIFWNNYNYYSTGSEFQTVSNGLGEVAGVTVNYPTGVGIVLFGSDGVISRNNNIFGNEKWGSMSISAPGAFGANENDDAKNLNNQFIDNALGRGGIDPNGTDFLDDATGGGNCYQGNGPNPTYVAGNGSVPLSTIYPNTCPQPVALNDSTSSTNVPAGIQIDTGLTGGDPDTVLGYAAADPPASMECSWLGNSPHPAYTDADGYTYTEARADPYPCP